MDDDEVEVIETIIFTFGEITNGTTETTDVTLNLESEDDPTITSMVVSPASVDEGSASVLTATIDAASSRDMTVPLTVTGTATNETDYTTTFDSQGESTKVYDSAGENSNQDYGRFGLLSDGRYAFVNGNTIRVYDPSSENLISISADRSYDYVQFSDTENSFYASFNCDEIWKVSILEDNTLNETGI